MQLKWYGHASFRITRSDGFTLVTDPYTPATSGYAPVTEPSDLAIASSATDDFHCRVDLIPGNPITVNALEIAKEGGMQEVAGITIQAMEAMEMEDHPFHDPDQNAMYRFEVDGIKIAHMGDVGNALTDRQIAFYEDIDILLALTGGIPTIQLDDLKVLIDRVKPKFVVPMHFRTLTYLQRNTFWIETFLAYFDDANVDFAFDYKIELTKDDLPSQTRVLVLDYAR